MGVTAVSPSSQKGCICRRDNSERLVCAPGGNSVVSFHRASNKWKEKTMMTRLRVILLLSLATLCTPAFGANPAGPGTINYVEAGATLAGELLTPESVGNATLETGQELTTGEGRVEMLLTPGVFLRLD